MCQQSVLRALGEWGGPAFPLGDLVLALPSPAVDMTRLRRLAFGGPKAPYAARVFKPAQGCSGGGRGGETSLGLYWSGKALEAMGGLGGEEQRGEIPEGKVGRGSWF